MTREDALRHIRVEVATHGRVTQQAIRLYTEHRISREAFNQTVARGMQLWKAAQPAEEGQQMEQLRWEDLIVTPVDGGQTCALRAFVDDPNYRDYLLPPWLILDDAGAVAAWEGFFISAPGEDPDSETPRRPVDWTGFRESLPR